MGCDDSQYQPRPEVHEDTIKIAEIQVERKIFTLTLKENVRGRFLRITEEGGNNHSSIIVPASGLEDFQRLMNEMCEMLKAADELPMNEEPKSEPAEDDAVGNR